MKLIRRSPAGLLRRPAPGPPPADLARADRERARPDDAVAAALRNLATPAEPRATASDGSFVFTPREYAAFYDFADLLAAGVDGTGQRIGIVGVAAVDPDDIALFRSTFGLPALDLEQLTRASRPPPPPDQLAQLEAVLDVTWSGAVAPGAGIVVAISSHALVDAIGYPSGDPTSVLSLR